MGDPVDLKEHVDKTCTYKCGKCDQKFYDNDILQEHLKSVHEGQNKTFAILFACEICEESFSDPSNLAFHHLKDHGKYINEKTKNSEKEIEIDEKNTSDEIHQNDLQEIETLNSITSNKKFECCNESFPDSVTLSHHQFKVHGKSSVLNQCEYCEKPFIHKETLIRHIKKAHGILIGK